MSRDELHELAALHAMDLLEGEELRLFENELRSNPEARGVLELYSETAGLVAFSAEEVAPSVDLEDRIFRQIDDLDGALVNREDERSELPNEPSVLVRGAFPWFPWGVAAALALTSGILWTQRSEISQRLVALQAEYFQQLESLDSLQVAFSQQGEALDSLQADYTRQLVSLDVLQTGYAQQVESIQTEYAQRVESLETEVQKLESDGALQNLRIAVLKSKLESAPNAQAVAVWNAAQQAGRLTVSELPALADNQDYQLWIIDPDYDSPVSAGVFNTNADGGFEYSFSGSEAISNINAFALSLESKGGNATPLGPIVLVGN